LADLTAAVVQSFSDIWSDVDRTIAQIETAANALPVSAELNNASQVSSKASLTFEKANAIAGYVRDFRKMSSIFFEGNLTDIRKHYAIIETNRQKIATLAQSIISTTQIDKRVMQIIYELNRVALSFRTQTERFHILVVSLFGRIREKIVAPPNEDSFLRSNVTQRDFLKCVLSLVNCAQENARITTQSIDRIHQLLLTRIIEIKSIAVKLILARPGYRDGEVLDALSQFAKKSGKLEIRQDHNLHCRLCVVDDKYAIVSSCDLLYDSHSWHFDAGVSTIKMIAAVSKYFDEIWEHSVSLDHVERPIAGQTKLIVYYDKEHHKRPHEILDEINEGLAQRDNWVRFRTSHIEGVGYVDSSIAAEDAATLLRDLGAAFLTAVVPVQTITTISNTDELAKAVSDFASREFTQPAPVLAKFQKLSKSTVLGESIQNAPSIIDRTLEELGRKRSDGQGAYEFHVYLCSDDLVLGYTRS
jgi:hypothetical protein